MIKSSSLLFINDFTYIKVLPNTENIIDIIKFGGVPENGIEQELIFHNEGSPYMINNREIVDMDGTYILKFDDKDENDKFMFLTESYFNTFFKD